MLLSSRESIPNSEGGRQVEYIHAHDFAASMQISLTVMYPHLISTPDDTPRKTYWPLCGDLQHCLNEAHEATAWAAALDGQQDHPEEQEEERKEPSHKYERETDDGTKDLDRPAFTHLDN